MPSRPFSIDLVLGTGGYASYPAVRAAVRRKVPCAMLEVNATPGMVVKRMSRKAACVFTSFPETEPYLKGAQKVVLTGSPVRQEILAARPNGRKERLFPGEKGPLVVSFWGSVGAYYKMCIRDRDGILFDLGVSSYQLDAMERGFSYMNDAPLDMRMDRSQSFTAGDVVNGYSQEELKRILWDYGEERYSGRIAAASPREQLCAPGGLFHKYLRAAGPQGRIGLLLPAQAAAVRAHSSGSAAAVSYTHLAIGAPRASTSRWPTSRS